jgi:hypothetical protein
MEHAALAGVHGRKTEGLGGVLHEIDGCVGSGAQGARARSLEAIGVEGDAIVFIGLEAEHLRGKVFEGAEELTIVGQKELRVGTFALDVDVAALEAIGIDRTGTSSDAEFEAEAAGGGQQPHQRGYLFCSLR